MSLRSWPSGAPIPAPKDGSKDTLDHCPWTLLLQQGSLWTVIAFSRDGNNNSLMAYAQALLLLSRGQRHSQRWLSSMLACTHK